MLTYEDYLIEKGEARACGNFDFPSFEVWSGKLSEKDMAIERIIAREKWDPLGQYDDLD
tara:strand:+ start:18911 stop:19087 length:177 start_codon:yes stop_codon:yes gene_type:complete